MKWIPALAILGLAVLLTVLHSFVNKAKAKRHMAGRHRLDTDNFARQFFPDCPDIAAKIKVILEKHLPLDLGRLRPEDEPVKDLRMDELDSMATVEFLMDVETEFQVSLSDEEAQGIKSFSDIVMTVHRKVQNDD